MTKTTAGGAAIARSVAASKAARAGQADVEQHGVDRARALMLLEHRLRCRSRVGLGDDDGRRFAQFLDEPAQAARAAFVVDDQQAQRLGSGHA
ncbi:MAG: hypothetical protein U1F25_16535 [Rubrivivax sp.]